MCERDEQLLLRPSRLAECSGRLLELVLPELDGERADDGDRDHGGAGVRLLRPRPGLVVVREGLDADELADRVPPGADRLGIVPSRPPAELHRRRD